jgi:PilZ domain
MVLVEVPAMPESTPKKSNKRLSRRNPARGTTRLRVYRNTLGLGPNIAATLLDLSETGLRVILKEAATVGQQVEVNLESAGTGLAVRIHAGVVWVVPSVDGTFVAGLRLTKSLAYRDFMALTKP